MKSPDESASPAGKSGSSGFSRRQFIRGFGVSAVSAATLQVNALAQQMAETNAEQAQGPGVLPITLSINGAARTFHLEPRVTLLEAIREHAGYTGPKEVCERATCGACTVLIDGVPVYACMMLAIEAQGREVTTVEGISKTAVTPLQKAIVECDGLQCGYCTPGFVMSLTALMKKTPHPTEEEVRKACSGHLCRCGSYPNIFKAALKATGGNPNASATLIRVNHGLA